MNIQYSMPPQLSGRASEDAAALNTWCGGLLTHLKKVALNIEDSNILSISADKLTGGTVPLSETVIESGNMIIDSNSITLINTDETGTKTLIRAAVTAGSTELLVTDESGSRYIRMSGSKLDINADSITADSLTATNMTVSGSLRAGTIHCDVLDAGTVV